MHRVGRRPGDPETQALHLYGWHHLSVVCRGDSRIALINDGIPLTLRVRLSIIWKSKSDCTCGWEIDAWIGRRAGVRKGDS
ncbi:MAG: hypothetical protein ACYC0V_01845 [Armatimonadota bacterium]